MARQDERAFKVTGFTLKDPGSDDIKIGPSATEGLKLAAEHYWSRVRRAGGRSGDLVIHLLDEKNHEVRDAIFSVTEDELFLTIGTLR